jgi:hypothetical protein
MQTIDTAQLEDVTGGVGEGVMRVVRAGLLSIHLLTGSPKIETPEVEPIKIEQMMPSIPPAGASRK